MSKTVQKLIKSLQKQQVGTEHHAANIDREETEGELPEDPLAIFKRDLHKGLNDVGRDCLRDTGMQALQDDRTEYELLRRQVNKSLTSSSEFQKQYIERELRRRRRIQK